MNKIFGIMLLAIVGIAELGVSIIGWTMGMIYLLLNYVIGTKKFNAKFRKLNEMIIEEFQDVIKAFKELIETV
mgnify:CR=1 FL=1